MNIAPDMWPADAESLRAEVDRLTREAARANARADVCLAQTRYWQVRVKELQADAWDQGHRDTMAYVASGNLAGDEWHAEPVNPYRLDGSPARPCGAGPCCLGDGHAGECRM